LAWELNACANRRSKLNDSKADVKKISPPGNRFTHFRCFRIQMSIQKPEVVKDFWLSFKLCSEIVALIISLEGNLTDFHTKIHDPSKHYDRFQPHFSEK
jgi:hypothetical protein